MDTIGKRVRAARQELGLTMKQLHDLTGLSTGNISDIENDRNTPSVASLVPLGRALRRSLDWLLTGEEPIARSNEQTLTCDGEELSQIEADLIAMFRLLPEGARKEVFDLVHFKYTRLEAGEKESIYWTYTEGSADEKSGTAEGREARDGTA